MQPTSSWMTEAESEIAKAASLLALDALRVKYLGKNGVLTEELKQLKFLSATERPEAGLRVNILKSQLEALIKLRHKSLTEEALTKQLLTDAIDITLPGRGGDAGGLHPITQTLDRIESFFVCQGFSFSSGPEIEDDYYNFEALNFPKKHPARASHDTFYFDFGKLLRTHTSPVQIREMQSGVPPFRVIASGRVYRCDFDVTHSPMFHQVEGLVVDKGITFANLKSILEQFIHFYFDRSLPLRFRPSFFPFTEPSAEVDMQCVICVGDGCRVCKETGWLEVLGCGMVHPNVLKNVQLDPRKYSGFAFGLGVERFAMLRYGINDLRLFFENDFRFLKEFN